MSFKIHLIIVCVIIVVVYLFWQGARNAEPEEVVETPVETGPRLALTITHASWGLGCGRGPYEDRNKPKDNFIAVTPGASKPKEDNVLEAVSKLCNGLIRCRIMLLPEVLGPDPAPDCVNKALKVEYRCFEYDRPWTAESSINQLDLDCSQHKLP